MYLTTIKWKKKEFINVKESREGYIGGDGYGNYVVIL